MKVIPKYNNDLARGGSNNDLYEFGAAIDELELGFVSDFIVKIDYITPWLLKNPKEKPFNLQKYKYKVHLLGYEACPELVFPWFSKIAERINGIFKK